MTTEEIMQAALDMVGFRGVPPDSGIFVPGRGIRRVLAGIALGPAEFWLARELKCDAALAHHPPPGLPTFSAILDRHVDQMVAAGVPEDEAVRAVSSLKEGYDLAFLVGNYDHVPSVARALGLPYLNIHNPLDELGRRRMDAAVQARLAERGPAARVQDVVDALLTLPEFARARTRPRVLVGSPDNPAGRTVVSHGAGTNGRYPVAAAYFSHGVSTLVYIHAEQSTLDRLRQEGRGNLVVAGHAASDACGICPFLDELESRGLEVVRISGL
ncbi:MAG: hypothetical protein K6T75_11670 [Acetobacteraceae bacterium]|nr:hypothetical protein [Acetobacteraceae bacterium]